MTYPKPKPGEPVRHSASLAAKTVEVVEAFERGDLTRSSPRMPAPPRSLVVRGYLPGVTGPGRPFFYPDISSPPGSQHPVVRLALPPPGSHRQIAITTKAGTLDDSVPCVIAGIVPADVDIVDASHQFAEVDEQWRLRSTPRTTSIRILYAAPDDTALSVVEVAGNYVVPRIYWNPQEIAGYDDTQIGDVRDVPSGGADPYDLVEIDGVVTLRNASIDPNHPDRVRVANLSKKPIPASRFIGASEVEGGARLIDWMDC